MCWNSVKKRSIESCKQDARDGLVMPEDYLISAALNEDGNGDSVVSKELSEAEKEKYREFVIRMATGEKPSQLFQNGSESHASIVMEVIFAEAKKTVHMLTNALSDDVYGTDSVIASAKDFLKRDRNAVLEIISETDRENMGKELLNALYAADLGRQIKGYVVPPEVSKSYKFNFAVADGANYRFEPSRGYRKANIRFGDLKFSDKLERAFKKIKKSAKPVEYSVAAQG
jgi:hypothetical protein